MFSMTGAYTKYSARYLSYVRICMSWAVNTAYTLRCIIYVHGVIVLRFYGWCVSHVCMCLVCAFGLCTEGLRQVISTCKTINRQIDIRINRSDEAASKRNG